jgi:hypothetical protein
VGCFLVPLEPTCFVFWNDLLEYLLQLLRVLLTCFDQWLNSFVGLLDVALQVSIDCQAVVFIYLLLDFLTTPSSTQRPSTTTVSTAPTRWPWLPTALTAALQERAKTPPPPSSTVPFRRDPDFVGRPQLKDLEQKRSTGNQRVALVGLGGVGYEVYTFHRTSARLMI